MNYKIENSEAWHYIGHQLVPKDKWTGLLDNVGMQGVVVKGQRKESKSEYVHMDIKSLEPLSILVVVNEHYSIDNSTDKAQECADILKKSWENTHRFAQEIAESVLNKCLESYDAK